MKRYVKSLIRVGLCLIPIGFVTAFITDWRNVTPISCVGSSGVKPFAEALANKFQIDHKNIDVTVEAGGSGFGISQVAHGFTDIGNASKNPFSTVRDNYQNEWEQQRIKTVTIGWEAICIVWIPPKDFNVIDPDILNQVLYVSDRDDTGTYHNNATDLLRIFSGFKQTRDATTPPDGTLAEFVNPNFVDSQQLAILAKQKITPYARTGGALTSGTASSFYGGMHYKDIDTNLTPNQLDALSAGNYGKDYPVHETDEANSRAWDMFNKDHIYGSMVYLSSAFISQPSNMKIIQQKHYGIMAYRSNQATNPVPFDINKVDQTNGYNWFRPLNMIFSIVMNKEAVMNFLSGILNDEQTMLAIGAKPLSNTEKSTMGMLATSDVEIVKQTNPGWNWDDGTVFGATEDYSPN